MNQLFDSATNRLRDGLSPVFRLSILGLLFMAEKVLLNHFVDWDRAQAAQGFGAVVRTAQHIGFRFIVAFCAALILFSSVRGRESFARAAASMRAASIRLKWIVAHVLFLLCLVPLTSALFADNLPIPLPAIVLTWLITGIGAALSAALALAEWSIWRQAAASLGVIWWYAAIAAFFSASAIQVSQRLWEPTTSITFELVQRILSQMIPSLVVDPHNLILSTDNFAVQVSEQCSGLEGMGLMLAFTIAWLVYFRREYIFPRVLLLIPVGLLTMFFLNALRIAALMMIGHIGFPGVAQYGFHSQAGWIAFNAAAGGLVFFSSRSAWLNREATRRADSTVADNPTAAYLVPLLAVIAAGMLSQAMSSGFDRFYVLRLIAGLGALVLYRRKLRTLDWAWSTRGALVGVIVFLLWVLASRFISSPTGTPEQLLAMSPTARFFWIASRGVTSSLVIPIAEELAYRGYLMRRLSSEEFESISYNQVRLPAVALAAVAFGLAHGPFWLPGIIAGLAFGAVAVIRNSIGEAVAAHITANVLVAMTVLVFGQWQLW